MRTPTISLKIIFPYDGNVTESATTNQGLRSIGRYRLIAKLGEGGDALVYRAELSGPFGFSKSVALKLIKPSARPEKQARQIQAFLREARLGGLLRHPYIVDVYEIGEHDGESFIAMELIDGWTLRSLLKRRRRIPPSIVLQIGRDICTGLSAAHQLEVNGKPCMVVHRDLKPANVMLDRFGAIRILDFGIALSKNDAPTDQAIRGTLAYMAPEQFLNKDSDGRTDIFALGAMLYELLTGLRLFRGEAPAMVRDRLSVDETLQNPNTWAPVEAVCAPFKPVLQRCLRRRMTDRYRSADELSDVLHQVYTGLSTVQYLQSWARQISVQHTVREMPEETNNRRVADETAQNKGVGVHATNLPRHPSSFFGRVELIQGLQDRLQSPGSVTLVGMGGMGKTRVALEVGHRMLSGLPGGVWFCDLVEAQTLAGLLTHLSAVLSEEDGPGEPHRQAETIGRSLSNRGRVLLILDNAEGVQPHLAHLLDRLEKRAPKATFLVTSRVALKREEEEVWRVDSLPLSDAEALFRDRSVRTLSQDEPALVPLMRQLDGLPLAIELAARRTELFGLNELLERLDHRFHLLRRTGKPAAPDRHATLTVVLDSTWESLAAWEQDVLAQCAVFRGGFRVEDAEEILDLSAHSHAPWVVDTLQHLIDKCLVTTHQEKGGHQRLNLLVSVWVYASAKLAEMPPEAIANLSRRHAKHYAKYGRETYLAALQIQGGETLRQRLFNDIENLVAATQRSVAANWIDEASCNGLATLTVWKNQASIAAALALAQDLQQLQLTKPQHLRVQLEHADLLARSGQGTAAGTMYRDAEDIARSLKDPKSQAICLQGLADLDCRTQKHSQALPRYTQALTLCHENALDIVIGPLLSRIAEWYHFQGDLDEALNYYTQAVSQIRSAGHTISLAAVLSCMGSLVREQGYFDRAETLFKEALHTHEALGNLGGKGELLNKLGVLFCEMGQYEEARANCEQAISIAKAMGTRRRQVMGLTNLGNIILAQGNPRAAQDVFQEALSIASDVHEHRLGGIAHANIAICYDELGNLNQAIRHFIHSLKHLEDVGDGRFEGIVITRLAVVQAKRGDMDQARKTFARGEEALLQRNERFQLALLYVLRGTAELQAGAKTSARSDLAKAEKITEEITLRSTSEVHKLIQTLREQLDDSPP